MAHSAVTKARYTTLDAMRGLAAIFVVTRHMGPYKPHFSYLAVDLFFVLSGFVLSYANDARFRSGMSAGRFLIDRMIRLYPLYLIGLLLGLLSVLVTHSNSLTAGQSLLAFCTELLGLPSVLVWPHGVPFSVDGVLWSIFFEFWIANIVFALLWKSLDGGRLWALIAACAAALLMSDYAFKTLDLGWRWNTFLPAISRVGFSFFLGVALARLHKARPPSLNIPSWLILVVLTIVFCIPVRSHLSQPYELGCVLIAFPMLIYWGAEARERNPAIGKLLGDASYAIYVIHAPLMEMVKAAALLVPERLAEHLRSRPALGAGEIAFVAVVAGLALALDRYIDVPIRNRLKAFARRVREDRAFPVMRRESSPISSAAIGEP